MTLLNPKPKTHNTKRFIPCERCGSFFVAEDPRGQPHFCKECKIPHRREHLQVKYQERKLRRLNDTA